MSKYLQLDEQDCEELRAQLVNLLARKSARIGEFTLASGARSNLYIDARMTAMSPEGLVLIGKLGIHDINAAGWRPDSVGGLTLGADPISYAIAYTSALTSSPVRAFTVRKEAKAHGTGKLIEGPFEPSDRVVIIEDVITTGGSAIKAINAVRNTGAEVIGVLSLVDREEGGRENIEAQGCEVRSLTRAGEIVAQVSAPSA
jgi:orotate phosphoribosyltransferase